MKITAGCLALLSYLFIAAVVIGMLFSDLRTALVVVGAGTYLYWALCGLEFLGQFLISNCLKPEPSAPSVEEICRQYKLDRIAHLKKYRKELIRGDEDFADTYCLCFHPVDSEINKLTADLGLDQENE